MQDLACGDYNRTPVVFQVPDICRIVGDSTTGTEKTHASNQHISAESIIQYVVVCCFKNLYKPVDNGNRIQ